MSLSISHAAHVPHRPFHRSRPALLVPAENDSGGDADDSVDAGRNRSAMAPAPQDRTQPTGQSGISAILQAMLGSQGAGGGA